MILSRSDCRWVGIVDECQETQRTAIAPLDDKLNAGMGASRAAVDAGHGARLRARRLTIWAGIVGMSLAMAGFSAQAEGWPTKPVKIIVPAAPGGSADPLARLVAEELGRAFQQSDFATVAAPMFPLAPGRFSTTDDSVRGYGTCGPVEKPAAAYDADQWRGNGAHAPTGAGP